MGFISKVLRTVAPERYQAYKENVRHQATMNHLSNLRVRIADDIHFNRTLAQGLHVNYSAFRNQAAFGETNIRTVEPADQNTLGVFQKIRLWFSRTPADINVFRFTNQLEEVHLASAINLGGEYDKTVSDVVNRAVILSHIDAELAGANFAEGKALKRLENLTKHEVFLRQCVLDSLNRTLNGAFIFKQAEDGQILISPRVSNEVQITSPLMIQEEVDFQPDENTALLSRETPYLMISNRSQSPQLQSILASASQNPSKEHMIVAFAQAYEDAQDTGSGNEVTIDWRNPHLINAKADIAGLGHRTAAVLIRNYTANTEEIAQHFEEEMFSARCSITNAVNANDAEGYVRALAEFHFAEGAYKMSLEAKLRASLPLQSQRNLYVAINANRYKPNPVAENTLGEQIRAEASKEIQEVISQTDIADLRRILAIQKGQVDSLTTRLELIAGQEEANADDGITDVNDPSVRGLVEERAIATAQYLTANEYVTALEAFFADSSVEELQAHDALAQIARTSAQEVLEHDRQIARKLIKLESDLSDLVATLYQVDVADLTNEQASGFLDKFDEVMESIQTISRHNREALSQLGIDERFKSLLEEVRRHNDDPRRLMRAILANEPLANAIASAQFMDMELSATPSSDAVDGVVADEFVLVNEDLSQRIVSAEPIYNTIDQESTYSRLSVGTPRSLGVITPDGDYSALNRPSARPSVVSIPRGITPARSDYDVTVHIKTPDRPSSPVAERDGYSRVSRTPSPNTGFRVQVAQKSEDYQQVRPLESAYDNARLRTKVVPLPSISPTPKETVRDEIRENFINAWKLHFLDQIDRGDAEVAKHAFIAKISAEFRSEIASKKPEELPLLQRHLERQATLLDAQLRRMGENLDMVRGTVREAEALEAFSQNACRALIITTQLEILDAFIETL